MILILIDIDIDPVLSPGGCGLTSWSLQVFQVNRIPDVASVPDLVHEPAHEAVPVHAVEEDARAVSVDARLQKRQVAARILAARALTLLLQLHMRSGHHRRSRLHCVLSVQYEVLLTGAESSAAADRVLFR